MNLEKLFQEILGLYPNWMQQKRDVEDIICFYSGLSWGDLQLKPSQELDTKAYKKILESLKDLASGKPCAYILGHKAFYKSEFKVDSRVLIPRPETEILVERALSLLPQPKRIVDLGTGSGCIGLSIAKEWPAAHCVLVDASEQALGLCRENQFRLGLENVSIHCCQVTENDPLGLGFFDLVVANPPYIALGDSRVTPSVHQFEPHQALYAEQEGLACIEKWLHWAEKQLNFNGQYIFEFGQNQEKAIEKLILKTRFQIVDLIDDYQSIPRFFQLRKTTV